MTKSQPSGQIGGRKDKTSVQGKVGAKFYRRTAAEERFVLVGLNLHWKLFGSALLTSWPQIIDNSKLVSV
jgi:hypothetical protein